MKELLMFIANNLCFLFEKHKFTISNSISNDSFGNDSCIFMESQDIKLSMIKDRGQFFLEFNSKYDIKKNIYSVDLIIYLIKNINIKNLNKSDLIVSVLNEDNVLFFQENIEKIEQIFNKNMWGSTIAELNIIKKHRGKIMFG